MFCQPHLKFNFSLPKQRPISIPNKNFIKIPFHKITSHHYPKKIFIYRYFATDESITKLFREKQISRVSVLNVKTNELIKAVRSGNYAHADFMVKNGDVDINSHNSGENTALTDAAERGDAKAIEFLIAKLKANPHASCDCPSHKTALHYASENGHTEAIMMLLKLGANPTVLDSRGYKAMDVAKTVQIKEMLESHERDNKVKYLTGLKKQTLLNN